MGGHSPASAAMGALVRREREARRMSAAELGRRLTAELDHTIHQSTVSKMEHGHRAIHMDEMLAICRVLDLPPSLLQEA